MVLAAAIILAVTVKGCGLTRDGVKKEYYDTGQLLSEVTYKNFRRHGPYKEYYKNGKLKVETTFQNGKINGVAKAYDEDGTLILKEIYDNGETVYRNDY